MDAAETLFSERGLDVSVRDIVAAAGANVAAVNYHFGSRDGLVAAVVGRKWSVLARKRLVALEALAAAADPPPVAAVVEAVVAATKEFAAEEGPAGRRWLELTGALWLARHPALHGDDVGDGLLYRELLRRALPDLPEDVFRTRLELATDQLVMGLRSTTPVTFRSDAARLTGDERLAEVVRFIAAGLAAPCPDRAAVASRR